MLDRMPLHRRPFELSRRDVLRTLTASLVGVGASGWMPSLARALTAQGGARRHCILLWMVGGPSQTDTFDMKPGHANGGQFKEIQTSAPGLRFSEHLPKLAQQGQHLAVMRGLSTREGDHGRGTYLMRTGRAMGGPVRYPTIGSAISKELAPGDTALPDFVSVAPYRDGNPEAYESGFLGPRNAPLFVKAKTRQSVSAEGFTELGVDDLRPHPAVGPRGAAARLELLESVQQDTARGATGATHSHDAILQRAVRLMQSEAGKVFDLSEEPVEVRQAYGPGVFGQGCLLARRLVERGVPFVEVSLGDFGRWDTHNDNFTAVQQLSTELDAGWGTLMTELEQRGLLESTTILWMGEFGRTPQINGGAGRDHYPNAWSAVLAGGGIKGGQAWGKTSADGMTVEEGEIDETDLLATLCAALGVDPRRQNVSDIGRPFKIAEGEPVKEVLA
jgi:hypothetical protein